MHLVRKQPGTRRARMGGRRVVAFVRVGAIARSRARIRRRTSDPVGAARPAARDARAAAGALRRRLDRQHVRRSGRARRAAVLRRRRRVAGARRARRLGRGLPGAAGLARPRAVARSQPLRATVAQLWADAAYGLRATGLDTIGPADPFAAVIAVIGTCGRASRRALSCCCGSLALPLAALGGWFAATRVTERSLLRITGGVLWMLAPTFLAALTQGRPTGGDRAPAAAVALLRRLASPIDRGRRRARHPSSSPRSWRARPRSPLRFVMHLAGRRRAGRRRCAADAASPPHLAARADDRSRFAPLVWTRIRSASFWGLLADPGRRRGRGPRSQQTPPDVRCWPRAFPTPDLGGWTTLLADWACPTWWVPLLVAPLAVLALLAPLTQRWAAGIALLVVGAHRHRHGLRGGGDLGLVRPVRDRRAVAGDRAEPRLARRGRRRTRRARHGLRPAARARSRGRPRWSPWSRSPCSPFLPWPGATALLTNGPRSTLPAYVAAEGRENQDVGTIMLTPQNAGGVSTRDRVGRQRDDRRLVHDHHRRARRRPRRITRSRPSPPTW